MDPDLSCIKDPNPTKTLVFGSVTLQFRRKKGLIKDRFCRHYNSKDSFLVNSPSNDFRFSFCLYFIYRKTHGSYIKWLLRTRCELVRESGLLKMNC